MVTRVSSVGPKVRLVELRIGPDKVLGEPVAAEHFALNGAWNKRQALIAWESRIVVENVQRVGQSLVVPVSEVIAQALLRGGTQMHRAGLAYSVHGCSHRSETGSRNVDAVEHLIQQRRTPACPGRVKRFLEAIGQEVRRIEVQGVEILARQRADVANVQSEVRGQISRDRQGHVLNVGADKVWIIRRDVLAAIRQQ